MFDKAPNVERRQPKAGVAPGSNFGRVGVPYVPASDSEPGGTAVMRNKTLAMLAAAMGVLVTTAAWASRDFSDRRLQGGYVKPCSLDGVNPVHHPEIFGNPAMARIYGFYLGPDRVWRVIPNCNIW
jgi:hypothetical protein